MVSVVVRVQTEHFLHEVKVNANTPTRATTIDTFFMICFVVAKIIKTCSFEKDIFADMKLNRSILVVMLFLMAAYGKTIAQSGNELYRVVKSSTGQSFLLNTKGTGNTLYMDVYFRIGPVYEFDSLSGISNLLAEFMSVNINKTLADKGKSLTYSCSIMPEQLGFHFELQPADVDYVLHLINDQIINPKFEERAIIKAKVNIAVQIDSLNTQSRFSTNEAIMQRLWGGDFKKLNRYGDQTTYDRIKAEDMAAFHKRYFLPFNSMICLLGSFDDKAVLDKMQDAFKDFKSKEFNPELVNKVIEFKPVINTIQLYTKSDDKSMVSVTYQNPGARQDRDATFSAFIVAQILNNPSGSIQKLVKAAGLKDVKATYTCNNFFGVFTLTAKPNGINYADAFNAFNQVVASFSEKDFFKPADVEDAKKSIAAYYSDMKANNLKEYMAQVARYRFSNDENYFTGLVDSINNVTPDHLQRYIQYYFAGFNGVRSLTAPEDSVKNAPTDQKYYPLDDSISEIKFTYDLNKADLETAEAKENLSRLIQWLHINPDIHVQINGFADQGEFTKAYDDSVLHFIDSTATFHKAMPDATRKGYLRIEFMRAMKIAKALYEAGITEDRISGTSMVFTSDSKEAAAANRKCTITLEKIKPRVSLYEYHFGKKKENTPSNN